MADVEAKERVAIDPKDKQTVERPRWEIDDRRRTLEKDRWRLEEEIGKVDAIIKSNSEKYQTLLAEEEKIEQRMEEIRKSLLIYA